MPKLRVQREKRDIRMSICTTNKIFLKFDFAIANNGERGISPVLERFILKYISDYERKNGEIKV